MQNSRPPQQFIQVQDKVGLSQTSYSGQFVRKAKNGEQKKGMSTSLDISNLVLSSTVDEFAIEDTRIWDNRDRDTSLTIATIAYLALSKFSWMEAVFSFWCLCFMVLSRAYFIGIGDPIHGKCQRRFTLAILVFVL